jgi:hypothetical protein
MSRATPAIDKLDKVFNVVGVGFIVLMTIQLVASIGESNWRYAGSAAISLVALGSAMLVARSSPRRGSPLMWIEGVILAICGVLIWSVR